MLKKASLIRNLLSILAFSFLIFVVGCNNSPTGPETSQSTTDQQAMLKAVEADSSISSFEPNYNEDAAMTVLGKTTTTIYPLKVGQKMRLVSRNFTYTTSGDTAYGTYSTTFEGVLFIAASYDSANYKPDTLIQKPFTTIITRKIIFVTTGDTVHPSLKWRIAAISLPEGGTMNSNISITKVTVFLPGGDTLVVTDPNSYFLSRGWGWRWRWWKQIPIINRNSPVKVQVELNSAYADTDFVTLTHGCDPHGLHREKDRFYLVSSTQTGNGYDKVYEQTFITHQWPGYFHAVINVFPKQVVTDDSTPVESNTWGIPYIVRW
jgi:hypothetical protein